MDLHIQERTLKIAVADASLLIVARHSALLIKYVSRHEHRLRSHYMCRREAESSISRVEKCINLVLIMAEGM